VPERDIRKALKKRVEAYGGEIRAVSWLGRRNAPDVFCWFPKHSAYTELQADRWSDDRLLMEAENSWIETKAPGGKPTAAQHREHTRMREGGCMVSVVSTIEQLDDWLPPRA
jgi:hypothetical protein